MTAADWTIDGALIATLLAMGIVNLTGLRNSLSEPLTLSVGGLWLVLGLILLVRGGRAAYPLLIAACLVAPFLAASLLQIARRGMAGRRRGSS